MIKFVIIFKNQIYAISNIRVTYKERYEFIIKLEAWGDLKGDFINMDFL